MREVPFPDSVQGADRRAPGHAHTGREVAAGRRGGDRQGVLGGRGRRMGDRDPDVVGEALRELSRKELVRPSRHSSMAGRGRVRVLAHPHPRRRLRPAPPRLARARATSPPPPGSSRKPPTASRTWPTCSPTTTRPHSSSPAPPDKRIRQPPWRRPRGGSSPWPANARSASTPLRRSPISNGRSRSPRRPPRPADALARFGEAAHHAGRTREAKQALEEAIPALPQRGDLPAPAHAMNTLASCCSASAIRAGQSSPREALALLEPLPPGPALVDALTEVARRRDAPRQHRRRDRSAERALALADELGLDRPARALGYRGSPAADLGDAGGLDDMREAIALATRPDRAARSPCSTTTSASPVGV